MLPSTWALMLQQITQPLLKEMSMATNTSLNRGWPKSGLMWKPILQQQAGHLQKAQIYYLLELIHFNEKKQRKRGSNLDEKDVVLSLIYVFGIKFDLTNLRGTRCHVSRWALHSSTAYNVPTDLSHQILLNQLLTYPIIYCHVCRP